MQRDFSSVTEITGYNVTLEQTQRMHTRYRFAAEFCSGNNVLEVACGSGQGLGILAKNAAKVTAGDIDEKILAIAKKHYIGRKNIEFKVVDAHKLPFEDENFEVVLLYEAIYYLSDPLKFISEAMRVLRKKGVLIICTANKELPDFNPSPYSSRYFSASELSGLLKEAGFKRVELFGDSPVERTGIRSAIISIIKRTAVMLNMIPKTMKGKEIFKRIFFGRLDPLPPELEYEQFSYNAPARIPGGSSGRLYKVIFSAAFKE